MDITFEFMTTSGVPTVGSFPDEDSHQFTVNTTEGSVLHRWLGRRGEKRDEPYPAVWLFLIAAAAAYLPIVIVAWSDHIPLTHQTALVQMPLFYDANTAWMFLVSFPTLLVLTVRDQRVLQEALDHVMRDGVIHIGDESRGGPPVTDRERLEVASNLKTQCEKGFRRLNAWSQPMAAAVGLVLAGVNFYVMSNPRLGAWGAPGGAMRPAGYLLLLMIAIFYAVVGVYVARSAGIVVFLRRLVKHAKLDMLPLHPDGCGGLRPMGQLGLRNQYALTIFGINVLFLLYVATQFLAHTGSMRVLVELAAGAYLLVGPMVFLGPLLPFRGGMLDAKRRLLQPIATRLREELAKIETNLGTSGFSKPEEELIDRLQKLGGMIDALPVWPFDARTIRRFLAAYVIPILAAVGVPLIDTLVRSGLHALG